MSPELSKAQRFYAIFLAVLIVFIHLLSAYLYFSFSNRLEPKVFYFPSATISSELMPELHNVPVENAIAAEKTAYNSGLEIFIRELFLGPQSIYLKNPIKDFAELERIIYSDLHHRSMLFVFIRIKNENYDKIEAIKEWLMRNIRNYYKTTRIILYFNEKLIE